GALARLHGAAVPPSVCGSPPRRSLEAIAIENATEGCVRETYGALVAMWQARFAREGRVRRAMARIAEDEARHAALAWEVAAWLEAKLPASANCRVRSAVRAAVAELGVEAAAPRDSELVREAGVPSRIAAKALHAEARRTLWTTAGG
ncbi:MAG: ferritin-like domain-containing protein, partial [Polyangiaceae bacterium]